MPKELIAHGKTWPEIAAHIGADEVVFQDLEDLKAACLEAADGTSQVEDFEVGVFCGKYKTEVPEGYFEHISRMRSDKKKGAGVGGPFLIGGGGPTNVAGTHGDGAGEDSKGPENTEDPRYVDGSATRDSSATNRII